MTHGPRIASTVVFLVHWCVFDDERGPGDDLRLAFEGTQRLDPDEQAAVRQIIEAMLLRHDARRWTQPTAS